MEFTPADEKTVQQVHFFVAVCCACMLLLVVLFLRVCDLCALFAQLIWLTL